MKQIKVDLTGYSKTTKKWMGVITKEQPITENEIIYFRKAIGSSSKLAQWEKQDLKATLEEQVEKRRGLNITPEQSEKGIEWLTKFVFNSKGERRKDKASNAAFGAYEVNCIKNFYGFTFQGVYSAGNGYYSFYKPIYRLTATNGDWFDYTTNMGLITVVGKGSTAIFEGGKQI